MIGFFRKKWTRKDVEDAIREGFKLKLEDTRAKAYDKGYVDAVTHFAWWKDGIQYVGSCGTRLADVLAHVEKQKALRKV